MPACRANRTVHAASRAVAAFAAAALLAVPGCGGGSGPSARVLATEPVLAAPPGATELSRVAENPRGGGLLGVERSGFVELIWASPATPDALAAHYRGQHGERYALNEDAGSNAGKRIFSGLGPKDGEHGVAVRIVVRGDRPHVTDGDERSIATVPPGTRSYVTVLVTAS